MTSASAISPGLPVELGEIEHRLGELWEQSEAAKARASLVNLVVCSEAPDAIEANTPLLAELAAEHAFRALLVQADPGAPASGVRAWITAHCHLRGTGQKEICSEQIAFRLDGAAAGQLASIVFSHLDSDLPLYLWWQGDLPDDPDPQLWSWVDRLLVDATAWENPGPQFARLRQIEELGCGRLALGDLAWTRLFHLFYAAAHIFDLPAARRRIARLRKIEICHAPGQRITALELLGWVASRFGWTLDAGGTAFRQPDGGTAAFDLREEDRAAAAIASVRFDFGDGAASVRRDEGGGFYILDFAAEGSEPCSQMMPAGREKTADILLSELSRSSRHPLYWPAIRAIEPLMDEHRAAHDLASRERNICRPRRKA